MKNLKVLFSITLLILGYNSYAVTGYTGTDFTGTEGSGNSISPANSGGTTSILRNTSWNDFEYNMTSYSTPQNAMSTGIVFRYSSSSAYYAVTIGYNGGGTYDIKLKSNNHEVLSTTGDIVSYNQASSVTSLKIRVEGTSIKVWINGTLRIDVTNSTHTSGSLGFIKTATWNVASVIWNSPTWIEVTSATVPTITTTNAASTIKCAEATSGAATISDGGASITEKGVCWDISTNADPEYSDSKTNDGTGTANFSSTLTGLTTGQTYKVRAYAKNSVGNGYGPVVTFTARSSTTAGSIGTAQTICSGATPAGLTQTGAAGGGDGSYTYLWQSSSDGSSWGSASGTNNLSTYSPGALTANTHYRRQVSSIDCGTANSSSILITVSPTSAGGSISSSASVCSGSHSGTLTLSGHTGSITKWQYSTDGGSNWTDIANTSTTESYTNLTATRIYRAVVTSGACSSANSSTATITVSPTSVGGSINSDASVCGGTNGATLTLSGHTGNVVRWESSSASNFASPTTISNTGTTQAYSNLTSTTYYRAVVQSGVCSTANSSSATITVTPAVNGGTIQW